MSDALVPCAACGRHYAEGATACPHCGSTSGPSRRELDTTVQHEYTPPPVVYGGPGMMGYAPRPSRLPAVLIVLAVLGVAAWLAFRWFRT